MSALVVPTTNNQMMTIEEFLTSSNNPIDKIYVDKFWSNIADDKWLYIGSDILEWIGYVVATDEYKLKKRYLELLNNFQEGDDYKHLCASEAKQFLKDIETPADFNTHNKVKHLFVSPDCFKESLMLMRTDKAKEIRKYYVQLEKVFKQYLKYQSTYIAQELETEKNRNTLLMASAVDYNRHVKKEYLYIATNARYASQNNFKIGKTQDLKQRLSAYNTSHNKREPYYYVYVSDPLFDAKTVEHIIKHILVKFRNSETNELYVVDYDFLEKIVKRICQNYDDSVDYYNELIGTQRESSQAVPISTTEYETCDEECNQECADKKTDKDDAQPFIEYFADNKDYQFTRFKADDGRDHFKCMRCGHVCTRIDALTSHFIHRKIKCWNDSKQKRIEAIQQNNNNPVIEYYLDNEDYSYFETVSSNNNIIYNCNRCPYQTDMLPSLKRHFGRSNKCWQTVHHTTVVDPDSEINLLDGIPEHKFVISKNESNEDMFVCHHCQYVSPTRARLRRHFKAMRKCWLKDQN